MAKRVTVREVSRIRGFQVTIAVIVAVALCFVIAYGVVRQQIDANTTALHVSTLKEAALAHKQSAGTCKAIQGMDNAQNGIKFSAATKTGSAEEYVLRLVKSIHDVYVSTGCQKLLQKQ
jgi:hypothetical protein